MPIIRLILKSEDETERHKVELSLELEEIDLLVRYVAQCDRLAKARIFESGFPSVTNIEWTNTQGLKFEVSAFDYSDVCELLHLARPVFLGQEPASFEKIQGLLNKASKGGALSQNLKFLRGTYERGDYQPMFQVSINDTPLFHDKTVMTWLNGVEYHQDVEKAAIVAALERSLSTDVMRGIFVSQLSGRIRATYMLADLARLIATDKPSDG